MTTYTPEIVRFSTVDNGARNHGRPFLQANVDGVRVRWDADHGWRCDNHSNLGTFECVHVDAVRDHLSRRINDRIDHLVSLGVVAS